MLSYSYVDSEESLWFLVIVLNLKENIMKKYSSLIISIVALIVAAVALAMNMTCNKTEKTLSVEETLNNNPEIVINALKNYELKQQAERQANAQKLINENIEALNNNPDSPTIGDKEAKVTVVEFFDFSCHYCHALYPNLKKVMDKNPDVKYVFKEMTFVAPVSSYAAKAALAANMQGKYAEVLDALMTNQGALSETKVDELAVKAGVDLEQMKADMNSEKVAQILRETSELAGKIQVNGVPALVINGKMVQTLDEAVIQSEIDAAKAK